MRGDTPARRMSAIETGFWAEADLRIPAIGRLQVLACLEAGQEAAAVSYSFDHATQRYRGHYVEFTDRPSSLASTAKSDNGVRALDKEKSWRPSPGPKTCGERSSSARTCAGARFIESDLSEVVMRGVQVEGADIDAPWLSDGDSFLLVNGVDVIPLVEAELNRRFPGRADRDAGDRDGLRADWAALERAWTATLARVATMPAGTVDMSVGGEWSFAQTLRHATEEDGLDTTIFATATPSYADVLEARAGRVAMVRDFLATATPDVLAATRKNPHHPEGQETTLSCLHVILEEECEHHRYAVRDLDAIETKYEA
jgi:hypothetical protein